MPRTAAMPTNLLLAPTVSQNPLMPIDDVEQTRTRDMEVQTMYRESEAQTVPYAPEYSVRPGESPTILLMADLTYEDGLPISQKEVMMVEFAIQKRELEANMPPFTDETSLLFRRKLMERQELKERRLREGEMDAQRELRMESLERALADREESAELATAQRVEALRERLMDERCCRLRGIAHHPLLHQWRAATQRIRRSDVPSCC
jgi:hypothetical protein